MNHPWQLCFLVKRRPTLVCQRVALMGWRLCLVHCTVGGAGKSPGKSGGSLYLKTVRCHLQHLCLEFNGCQCTVPGAAMVCAVLHVGLFQCSTSCFSSAARHAFPVLLRSCAAQSAWPMRAQRSNEQMTLNRVRGQSRFGRSLLCKTVGQSACPQRWPAQHCSAAPASSRAGGSDCHDAGLGVQILERT